MRKKRSILNLDGERPRGQATEGSRQYIVCINLHHELSFQKWCFLPFKLPLTLSKQLFCTCSVCLPPQVIHDSQSHRSTLYPHPVHTT